MIEKRILFDKFEFSKLPGLVYLFDEDKATTDYLFVNGPKERFSIYFEKDFPIFTVPESSERPYCLLEIKRPDRTIKFFCPEKHKNLDTVVWYFCMEIPDKQGSIVTLPCQVRVNASYSYADLMSGKSQFVEILESIKLKSDTMASV